MLSKIKQLNENAQPKLDADQLAKLDTLMKELDGSSQLNTSKDTWNVVFTMLSWKSDIRFPAIDLCRILVLRTKLDQEVIAKIVQAVKSLEKDAFFDRNSGLAMKLLTNMATLENGLNWSDIFATTKMWYDSQNKGVREAYVTMLAKWVFSLLIVQLMISLTVNLITKGQIGLFGDFMIVLCDVSISFFSSDTHRPSF